MRALFLSILFIFAVALVNAQPCKVVKIGMTKDEVLKLAGPPTEIDSLGMGKSAKGGWDTLVVWQYGKVGKPGNQRVQFTGGRVDSEVIADGLKYDELMGQFRKMDITFAEYQNRLKKLNQDYCK